MTIAQSLPLFGTARFGQSVFGVASTPTAIPATPHWLLIVLTLALWTLAYLSKAKKH
jgi:hypothetical protein